MSDLTRSNPVNRKERHEPSCSFERLWQAKTLADKLGGIEQAKRALDVLSELC